MASRVGYPGVEAVGDVLTKTNFDRMPGGLIGYAIATAFQSGISTITDLTGLSVAVTVGTNRMIRVEGFVVLQQSTGAGNSALSIREGAATLTQANASYTANGQYSTGSPAVILAAPSSGSHTYKLSLSTDANTVGSIASSTVPAYIAVYDAGPSF